jgi:cellulose synthase/poly-beta-1,6-N-acetylglucosamine synthase-like glycosyltransferase
MDKTGAKAIQGHRVAANLNTNFAILDAVSEEVNNHIYRKGHRVLGLSSGLIGSGMAFDYMYFKNLMAGNKAIGGFDKESELKILRDKIRIEYVEDALVFDEKVENPEIFGNQRRRWISAQVHYFKKYFLSGFYHLFTRGNVDFFDKAFQQVLLPRAMVLAMVFLMAGLAFISEYVFDWLFYPGFKFWLFIMLLNCAGLMLAIPGKFYNRRTLKAVSQLPKAIIIMFLTIFRLKGANKKFIHTPHSGNIDIKP